MNPDRLDSICEKIKDRVNTEEGQRELRKIADETREEGLKLERACQVSFEDLIKPFTI